MIFVGLRAITLILFLVTALLGVSGWAEEILYSEDFEGFDLGIWRGKSNIQIINDPTEKNQSKVLIVKYPAKSVKHGMTFKKPLEKGVDAACLTYEVYFPKYFEFTSGKLPGLAGGNHPTGCVSAELGFSNRFVFKPKGRITQYIYHPDKKQKCGEHVTMGKLIPGQWNTIKSCLRLGIPNKKDGWFQSWINGKTIGRQKIKWRNDDNVKIDALLYSSFYGGGMRVAPKRVNYALFDNFRVYNLVDGNN